MQHRTHKKKDLIEDDPQAGLSPYEKWKVKTDVRCLSHTSECSLGHHCPPILFFPAATQFCFKSPVRLIDMHRYSFWKVSIYGCFFHAGTKRRSHSKMDWVVALLGPERQGEVNSKLLVPEWKKCLRRDVEMLCCYEMKDLWLQFLEATFLCTRSPWYTHNAGVVGAHWYRCSPFVCCRSSWKCGMDLYIKLRSVGSCKTSKIWEEVYAKSSHAVHVQPWI